MLRALIALSSLHLFTACAGTECHFNSQCGARHYCQASHCLQDCRVDTDCVAPQVCSPVGQCGAAVDGGPVVDAGAHDMPTIDTGVPPVDLGTPPVDLGTPPVDMGAPVDTGTPPVDMGTPPVDLGTPKPYLADCTADGECASHHCIVEGPGTSHVCSQSCGVDDDCADWHFCNAGTCAYDDTGVSCSSTSTTDCNFACLYSAPHRGRCTHRCTTGADCPGGYGCVYSTPGDASSLKVCAWIHETCPTDSSDCDTSIGFCGAGSSEQCTGNCATVADCPRIAGTPYTCGAVSGATYTVCIPPTVGSGPGGSICSANSDCRSDICAIPEAGSSAQCLERCRPTTGCGSGSGCNAVSIGGVGMNICVPAGLRRGGDTCTLDSECRSGICGTTSRRCIDSCQNGFCPPAQVCTPDGLTVEGIMLRSCR